MGRKHDIECPLRMPQVKQQRRAGKQQKAERCHERKFRHGLELVFAENMVQRGNDESSCHKARYIGIQHDHEAPENLNLIGKNKSCGQHFMQHHRTSLSRPL